MKIGILSMQKIHNYGSFLQALSLKLQLEVRGHDVYFIDILAGRQITPATAISNSGSIFSKFDRYFFKRIENYLLFNKMAKLHTMDYERYLETDKKLADSEIFDLVIIGSDEVFNATAPSWWGFSTQLFGDIKNTKRVVTYAASCGHTTFESAKEHGIVDELKIAMSNLVHISVRDENTADFVDKILNIKPTLNVDPVFISNFDKYIPTIKQRKPYLLVYAYSNRISDKNEISAIKQYAKKNNLDILCVGMQQRWCKHNIAASGFELLAYVKAAACVVTDTFHGTVFSIKYNKRFVSLIRESNKNKLGGLLAQFDLCCRSVADVKDLESVMNSNIDYDKVNNLLAKEIQKSYSYLDMVTEG